MTSLTRREYDAAALLRDHPPQIRFPQKKLAFDLCSPPGAAHRGRIAYSRWAPLPLPARAALHPTDIRLRPEVYDYAGPDEGVWHVNFADPLLFCAYGSRLLAQDELQALEHPALGALREALIAERLPALTEDDSGPTPVLVAGVERRCALDTAPGRERPLGLYGNRFALASPAQVHAALQVLDPPPRSNILAMAAPSYGRGRYDAATITRVLLTAWTGFSAAREESARLWPGAPVEVRTGFWGCGAFGGSRPLMALLQVLAARLAGLDVLTFYAYDLAGERDFAEGQAALAGALGAAGEPLADLVGRIESLGFAWGQSDGN